MTPEEIKSLAIEHKLINGYDGDGLIAVDNRLVAYTAAVEARERERCAEWVSRNLMPASAMADEIRSWK